MSSGQFIRRLTFRLRHGGLPWLTTAIQSRIWPTRSVLAPQAREALQDKLGLEIGGPSQVFSRRAMLPVYRHATRIDNVNFANVTAWESGLREGGNFIFDSEKSPGRQFLREATDLSGIADATYDFVLSSHCLEHVANPLSALIEWRRVARDDAYLILILPNQSGTFDHRRPVTTMDHLREDFSRKTGEDDLTHLPEILQLHDLKRDPLAGSFEQFHARGLRNHENRCLHHHVFDLDLMRSILNDTGWEVVGTDKVTPIHLIALAKKKK